MFKNKTWTIFENKVIQFNRSNLKKKDSVLIFMNLYNWRRLVIDAVERNLHGLQKIFQIAYLRIETIWAFLDCLALIMWWIK